MKLGAFSVSLAVKDLKISRTFYERMGFTVFAGSMESNYLIMKNEETLIGLFFDDSYRPTRLSSNFLIWQFGKKN